MIFYLFTHFTRHYLKVKGGNSVKVKDIAIISGLIKGIAAVGIGLILHYNILKVLKRFKVYTPIKAYIQSKGYRTLLYIMSSLMLFALFAIILYKVSEAPTQIFSPNVVLNAVVMGIYLGMVFTLSDIFVFKSK